MLLKSSAVARLTCMYWAHQERAQLELKKDLTAADRPTAWRLLFNDAASYNVQTGKGGVNASIVLEYGLSSFIVKTAFRMHRQDSVPCRTCISTRILDFRTPSIACGP